MCLRAHADPAPRERLVTTPPSKLKPELVTDAADHEILHDSHEYMFVDIPEEEEEKLAAPPPPPPRGGFFPW